MSKKYDSSDAIAGCVAILGIVLLVLILVPTVALVNGFVLTRLWQWFVVETFGLHGLTLLQAIGVSMIVTFLTYRNDLPTKEAKGTSEVASRIAMMYISPLITLLFGYIVHLFM